MKRPVLVVLLPLAVIACGVVKGSLPMSSSATCTSDSDCTIPRCPDQCGGGQPYCQAPVSYGKTEAKDACPCLESPTSAACAAPRDCVQPECVGPNPADFRPACSAGKCVTRLLDGGAP